MAVDTRVRLEGIPLQRDLGQAAAPDGVAWSEVRLEVRFPEGKAVANRRLVIRLETTSEREELERFLAVRQIASRPADDVSVTVAVGEGGPSFATIVAAVEEWRRGCCCVTLEADGRIAVLRTET